MSKNMNYEAMWEELAVSANPTLRKKMKEIEKKSDLSPTVWQLWVPLKIKCNFRKDNCPYIHETFNALFTSEKLAREWFTCICEIGMFPKSYGGSFFSKPKLSEVNWEEICYVDKEVRKLCREWGYGQEWLLEHEK